MIEYRFFLYHKDIARWVRIKDPIGWDSLGKTIKRFGLSTPVGSPWHGIFFQYEVKLGFIKNGKNFIQKFFGLYGIEQDILLRIEKRNTRTREFFTHYEGRLNLSTYEVTTIQVTCNIEQTGFVQKLKNLLDVKINLEKTETLSGKSITPFSNESKTIELHSKVLTKLYTGKKLGDSIYGNSTISNYTRYVHPYLDPAVDEIEESLTYHDQFSTLLPEDYSKYFIKIKPNNQGHIDIQAKFKVKARAKTTGLVGLGGDSIRLDFYIKRRKEDGTVTSLHEELIPLTVFDLGYWYDSGWLTFDITYSITAAIGDELYAYFDFRHVQGGTDTDQELIFDLTADNFIKCIATTTTPPTNCKVHLIHEAFDRVVTSITDRMDTFYSEYYGRTDSERQSYDSDGPGSLRVITNGNQIRAIDKPVHCSFKDLVDTAYSLDAVGFGIERVNGVERVRAEPLTYWYQSKRMMRLSWVLDVKKRVIPELYFNEITGGIDKWSNEKITNLDEFNASREWLLPITQLKSRLEIKSPYITSGYSIEFTRRESINPTKDTPKDNENFIIRVARSDSDFVTEKNEAFDSVTGVISPETSYNLKDSPARCLRRHGRHIRAFLEKQKAEYIKFSFGDANTDMVSTLTSEGVAITENADILINTLEAPLFLAEVYTVRAKLTYEQMLALEETDPDAEANVWGFVEFASDDKNFKRGYLLEAKLAGDSNEVVMELIRANI